MYLDHGESIIHVLHTCTEQHAVELEYNVEAHNHDRASCFKASDLRCEIRAVGRALRILSHLQTALAICTEQELHAALNTLKTAISESEFTAIRLSVGVMGFKGGCGTFSRLESQVQPLTPTCEPVACTHDEHDVYALQDGGQSLTGALDVRFAQLRVRLR